MFESNWGALVLLPHFTSPLRPALVRSVIFHIGLNAMKNLSNFLVHRHSTRAVLDALVLCPNMLTLSLSTTTKYQAPQKRHSITALWTWCVSLSVVVQNFPPLSLVSEALHSSLYYYCQSAMFLSHPNNTLLLQEPRRWFGPSLQVLYCKETSMDPRVNTSRGDSHASLCSKGTNEKIREMFTKVEHSISSYDTAWVAMVPSASSTQTPYFPGCLTWVLENQLPDGSWGLHRHPLLIKDVLLSTLACIIVLKKWNVGEEHVTKGLQFIESNFYLMNDENQHTTLGFDIIFPGMIQYAQNMGLILPLSPVVIDGLLQKRDFEFKSVSGSSNEGRKVYLAYVSEGLGWLQDWRDVMKYQRKNGSLFNSPSTTAAALIHLHDTNSLKYLHSLTERFGNAVPTTYPVDMFSRLCFVDGLERLGIDRHFINEIQSVLDEIYRCWLHMDEEIFTDTATCALAFRILRMHGYDISSDALAQFDEDHLFSSSGTYVKDMGTVLELYRASQVMIFPAESILEELQSWSSHFLKQQISEGSKHKDTFCECINQEVEYALKFPYYANLERLESKRNVEHYNVNNLRILKTSYRFFNVDCKDFLELAVEDFNLCQSIHRNELKQLERWVKENRLDTLKFARQKLTYCYFSAAATLFSPELSDARMSWAKNGVLTTVIDDFFDIGGSKEELENLIKQVEKWSGVSTTDFYSEQVEIIFSALKCTVDEIDEKAFAWQGRSVANHLIEIWHTLLKSMMKEADWVQNKSVPTLDEYSKNGYVSFALGPIVLPTLYFIGPQLSEEVVRDPEYHNLYKLMSTCGRLLNDIQGFKKESKEGKLNSISLQVIHGNGEVSEEEVEEKTRYVINSSRRELLRLVLQTKDSVLPRACKDVFWKMSKVVHLFYMKNDGFTSAQEMVGAVNAVIQEPLNVPL